MILISNLSIVTYLNITGITCNNFSETILLVLIKTKVQYLQKMDSITVIENVLLKQHNSYNYSYYMMSEKYPSKFVKFSSFSHFSVLQQDIFHDIIQGCDT